MQKANLTYTAPKQRQRRAAELFSPNNNYRTKTIDSKKGYRRARDKQRQRQENG